MKKEELKFDQFVKAIEQYELKPEDVKATAHVSAVSIRWDRINELTRKNKKAKK